MSELRKCRFSLALPALSGTWWSLRAITILVIFFFTQKYNPQLGKATVNWGFLSLFFFWWKTLMNIFQPSHVLFRGVHLKSKEHSYQSVLLHVVMACNREAYVRGVSESKYRAEGRHIAMDSLLQFWSHHLIIWSNVLWALEMFAVGEAQAVKNNVLRQA